MTRVALALVVSLAWMPLAARAQDAGAASQTSAPASPPPYRISGLVFGDYYGFPDHHLPTFDGQQGFWFRRIYFTYDHTFSPTVTTRLRIEMNGSGDLQNDALTPYVKDAYLRWTYHGRQALTLGMQPSLTIEYIEDLWGLRHIEKTPLDLYRVDSSRDTGITLGGPIAGGEAVQYSVQYGNGSGTGSETDAFKTVRAAVRYAAKQGLAGEVMVGQFYGADEADRTLAQVGAAYRSSRGRLGVQYAFQKRRAPAGASAPDENLDIVSGFGVYHLKPQKVSLFARVDRFNDPCADCPGIDYLPIDATAPFTLTIAGLEYYLLPAVRLSPNLEYVRYSASPDGTRPRNDAVLRLTFFWSW